MSSLQATPDQLQAPAVFVVSHPTDVVSARSSRAVSSLPGIAEQVGGKTMTRRARTVRSRAEGGGSLIRALGWVVREGGARGSDYEDYGKQEESVMIAGNTVVIYLLGRSLCLKIT